MNERLSDRCDFSPWLLGASLAAIIVIVGLGSVWAFSRGGNDFRVFYHAWRLVLEGRGADIYRDSPDRFLYAPGFAWILAPLGALPFGWALAVWCAAKAAVLAALARAIANRIGTPRSIGIVACGIVMVTRPLLIDFEYGQVNLLILGACAWALFAAFEEAKGENRLRDFLSWALLGAAAITKLFPLPLLLVPAFRGSPREMRRNAQWAGAAIGALIVILLPVVTSGLHGLTALYPQWHEALVARGLPLESHNQSFAAFLFHFLSGEPTQIIAQHRREIVFGASILSLEQIQLLAAAWSLVWLGIILLLVIDPFDVFKRDDPRATLKRLALLTALLVVPSHLVWKPYFLFGLPAATLAADRAFRERSAMRWAALGFAFVMMNLTGFDFVGLEWGARFESASLMLWAQLLYCAVL